MPGFLIAVPVVLFGIHYYIWRRLVRDTARSRAARRVGTAIIVGLSLLVIAAFVGSRALPHGVVKVLAWPGYLWLAIMFYLVVVLVVLEIPALVVRLALRRTTTVASSAAVKEAVMARVGTDTSPTAPEAPDRTSTTIATDTQSPDTQSPDTQSPDTQSPDTQSPDTQSPDSRNEVNQSRRLFLARTVAITAGVSAVGLVGSGISTAMGPPQLKRIQIPLAKLPRSADGLRIALVSDIHLGPLRGYSHTRRIVDMINGQNADIVAVVGDLVDGSVAELGQAASPLRDLQSRLGAFFVTGNHEYFSGHEEWVEEVAELGVRPLRNERIEVAGFDLAGVNDPTGSSFDDGPDFDRALGGRDPSRALVLLAHQPVLARQSAEHGVDLQLSGHTHGGQLMPFQLIVRASGQPVVSGLGDVGGMLVYVTNGAGFWGPPVRVGAPPDISIVELRAG